MDAEHTVDALFARYDPTPDLLDFREEVLSNLRARVRELEAGGLDADEAAALAARELGDIDAVAREMSTERVRDVYGQMYLHHRVRPSTGAVVALTGFALVAALGVAAIVVFVVLELTGTIVPLAVQLPLALVLTAVPTGALVFIGLRQETTQSLPLPAARSAGYGLAGALACAGLVVAGLLLAAGAGWVVPLACGLPLVLAATAVGVVLGVTQTNRKKPWARREAERQADAVQDNFTADPALAARFGLYTAGLWVGALVVVVVAGIAIGFQYSWAALPLAVVVQMVLIARMGFGPRRARSEENR